MASKKRKRRDFSVNGKRYCVYGYTKEELNQKENAKREALKIGLEKRTDPTVKQYYEKWSDRRTDIKESTLRGQEKMFVAISAVTIADAGRTFGELKLKEVSINDLVSVQRELVKKRRTRTVNDYMAHMRHCFNDAMNERVIDYNPFVALKNLKITEEAARDTHHRALSQEEQDLLFYSDEIKRSSYCNVFRFAILTGMRAGEIGALKYSDIRNGKIHIERTVTRSHDGSYIIGESAKTEAGKRTIPLNDEIQTVLHDQKELNRVVYGNNIPIGGTIFRAPEGGLLMATPADRDLKSICNKLGIKPITMHGLRATFATRAIESGMNPRTLQELLGHTNFNLTMSLYGHVLEDTKEKEMGKLSIKIS